MENAEAPPHNGLYTALPTNRMRRQKLLSFDYDVLRPVGPGNWKGPYVEDRIAFVRVFYEYARANPNGRPQLWSEWLKSGSQ